jgi:hypothetical protein
MVVISTLILCSISFTHHQVRRFCHLPTVYIHMQERFQLQSKSNRFCALSYNPYTKLYIRELLRNVLIPWNMDGRLDLSSWIESGFLPNSFFGLYSDGGNHIRVFIVSYAFGRILSIPQIFGRAAPQWLFQYIPLPHP